MTDTESFSTSSNNKSIQKRLTCGESTYGLLITIGVQDSFPKICYHVVHESFNGFKIFDFGAHVYDKCDLKILTSPCDDAKSIAKKETILFGRETTEKRILYLFANVFCDEQSSVDEIAKTVANRINGTLIDARSTEVGLEFEHQERCGAIGWTVCACFPWSVEPDHVDFLAYEKAEKPTKKIVKKSAFFKTLTITVTRLFELSDTFIEPICEKMQHSFEKYNDFPVFALVKLPIQIKLIKRCVQSMSESDREDLALIVLQGEVLNIVFIKQLLMLANVG